MFNNTLKLSTVYYLLFTVFLTGCIAPLIIGGVIVTGYAVAKDTVTGNVEVTFDELWNASVKVLSQIADITDQNMQAGLIKATQNNNTIAVKIRELTEHSHNLRVSCRRSVVFTNLTLAQQIFTKILRNMGIGD
jgi:hypothetical protein